MEETLASWLADYLRTEVNRNLRVHERPGLQPGTVGQLKEDGTLYEEKADIAAENLEIAQGEDLSEGLSDAVSGGGFGVSGDSVYVSGDGWFPDAEGHASGDSVYVSGDGGFLGEELPASGGSELLDAVSGGGIPADTGDGTRADGDWGRDSWPLIKVYDTFVPSLDDGESHFPYISIQTESGEVQQGKATINLRLKLGTYTSDTSEGVRPVLSLVRRVVDALIGIENGIFMGTYTIEGDISWEVHGESGDQFGGADITVQFASASPYHHFPSLYL